MQCFEHLMKILSSGASGGVRSAGGDMLKVLIL